MNQLFIVIGMFIGQSLSFPFAEYSKWRYVFALSVALAMLQIFSSGLIRVPQLRRDIKRTASEEDALLASEDSEERQEERNLSIKDLFTSKDKAIRKGRTLLLLPIEHASLTHQSTLSSSCFSPSSSAASLQASPSSQSRSM